MKNESNSIEKCPALMGQEQTANQPSKGKWTQCAILAAVGLAAALLTGCAPGKYTGGGFIDSAAGGKAKATFGFSLEGIDQDGDGNVDQEAQPVYDPTDPTTILYFEAWALAKGQCDYNDLGAGVQFHLDIVPMTTLPADGSPPSGVWVVQSDPTNPTVATGAYFYGPYTSRAGTGQAFVSLTAKGDQYSSLNDTIEVSLRGGPYDGYNNSGTIQGGNIQWHPTKTK